MTTAQEVQTRTKQQRNLQLAEQGKFQCHTCGILGEAQEAIVIIALGTPWISHCRDCAGRTPLVIKRVNDELYIGPLDQPDLVVAKSMSEVGRYVQRPTFKKREY